jgi:DUF1680 family protein
MRQRTGSKSSSTSREKRNPSDTCLCCAATLRHFWASQAGSFFTIMVHHMYVSYNAGW